MDDCSIQSEGTNGKNQNRKQKKIFNFMNQKNIFIILFAVPIIGIIGYLALVKNQNPVSQTQQTVFTSQEECEQKTRKQCIAQMCDYVPPGNLNPSDPLGNLTFNITLSSGVSFTLSGNASNVNNTVAANATITLNNPNALKGWDLSFKGATLNKLSSAAQNITNKMLFNESDTSGSFIGMNDNQCQTMMQVLRPSILQLCIPGNLTELWQCDQSFTKCVNQTASATLIGYNSGTNKTCWDVPASWGC